MHFHGTPLDLCLALVVRVEVSPTNRSPKIATGQGVGEHCLHAKCLLFSVDTRIS